MAAPLDVPGILRRLAAGAPVDENLLDETFVRPTAFAPEVPRVVPPRLGFADEVLGAGRVVDNPTVPLEYLRANPSPAVYRLNHQYTLPLRGGFYLLELAGVAGTPSPDFMADELLGMQARGTMLFWFHEKKIRTPLGGIRVSSGKVSARGTGKTRVFAPRVGRTYALAAKGDGPGLTVTLTHLNARKGYLLAVNRGPASRA